MVGVGLRNVLCCCCVVGGGDVLYVGDPSWVLWFEMLEELVGSGSNLFIGRPRWVGSVGCSNFGFRFRVQLRFRFRVGRECCVSVVDDLGRVTSRGVCLLR